MWSGKFPLASGVSFHVTGFGEALQKEGLYRLVITPQDKQGFMLPLTVCGPDCGLAGTGTGLVLIEGVLGQL